MKNANLYLKIYAITLTFVLGFLLLSGFKSSNAFEKFDEITVERINIVEPDGSLKMVISNSKKQHPGMFDGKPVSDRKRPAGIIFFNEEQDEVGGLIYHGNKKEGAGMALSFDQYKNDQVMQVQYGRDEDGQQQYGLNFWDRSEKITLPRLISIVDSLQKAGVSSEKELVKILTQLNDGNPISAQRMFTGKNFDKQVGLFIMDESGNDRIKIYVDENNQPKFEILDKDGKLVQEILK